jgi:hypothetical protein
MSRRREFNKKEYDELQKLKHENQKLKKQVAALRKQITRIDIDRYENLKHLIDKYDNLENKASIKKEKDKLKQKWQCFDCKTGIMYVYTTFRVDGQHYYRKCNNCNNKTKLKPYTANVEGLFYDEDKE